jgi:hypothetical protein
MTTKAYFLIEVKEGLKQSGYAAWLKVAEAVREEPRLSIARQREIIHARKGEMKRFRQLAA